MSNRRILLQHLCYCRWIRRLCFILLNNYMIDLQAISNLTNPDHVTGPSVHMNWDDRTGATRDLLLDGLGPDVQRPTITVHKDRTGPGV